MQRTRMRRALSLLVVALGVGCARYHESSAGGEVINPGDADATVVLHVQNLGMRMVELRSIQDGRSRFIASVGAQDTASVLLDPLLFPTASLFIAAYAHAGGQRIVVGPLAAGRGDQIDFTVQEGLVGSQANVRR
jgi:hypothetical protein